MNTQTGCRPHRITDFLNGQLSEADQIAFEQHLGDCLACRELLGAQTADDEFWDKAERYLRENEESDGLSGSHDALLEYNRQANIQHVINALTPTDDPAMLGRLGGHEVSGVVGAGAMGVVLKAQDASLDRVVAIKVLAPHLASSGAARKRFAREAKAAAAVLHPNVIAIHSVSNDESLPYLVMPFVRGTSLQKRLDKEGSLPVSDILRIGSQIAAGLSAAHGQGLVHRDVKPANILLEEGVERVAITDFGLARAVDDASMTCSGLVAGTPQYMSPEQARGEAVDQRSDLFSLGAVLYALCTGHPPFRAESTFGVLRLITDKQPRPIQEINPDVPGWLCWIISKLMSKQPEGRFASASEVADLLEDCLAHVQQPNIVPLPLQVDKLKPRGNPSRLKQFHRAVLLAAGSIFLLIAAAVIVLELNKGKLIIESDVDGVPVRIMQGDKIVDQLTVSRAGASVRIAAGPYVVEVDGELDGITVDGKTVKLRRGGREVVKIVKEVAAEKSNVSVALNDRAIERLSGTPDGDEVSKYSPTKSQAVQTDTNPLSSDDQLAGYREFLWQALREQQRERDSLLSVVTSCEQRIVALQESIKIPADADEATKERLGRDRASSLEKIVQLKQRIQSVGPELQSARQQIKLLEQKLAAAQTASEAGKTAIVADILAVSYGHVELSVGDDEGILNGLKLKVSRGKVYLGEVEVVRTEAGKSLARVIHQTARDSIRAGDRATVLLDSPASKIVGRDVGEPIYNDRLRRFKFRLDKINVTSAADAARSFWLRYQGQGYPQLAGVWGDPRDNSLVVVGPPEADQPIRDTIAKWEGAQLGIELDGDGSLEGQREQLQRLRRSALREVTGLTIKIIDAKAAGEQPDSERLTELSRQLEQDRAKLATIESKLNVINDSIQQLQDTRRQQNPEQEAHEQAELENDFETRNAAAEVAASFDDAIDGRWIIESCELRGKTNEPMNPFSENVEAERNLRDYAVVDFGKDRVSFAPGSDYAASWSYRLDEQSEPRRITLGRYEDNKKKGIIWAWKRQLVMTLAIDGGDYPKDFRTEGTSNVTLRFKRDETDSAWQRRYAAGLRKIGKELLLRGTAAQQPSARKFMASADSWEREANLREQAESASALAEEHRKVKRIEDVRKEEQRAREFRLQAERERSQRNHRSRIRKTEELLGVVIRRWKSGAAALRQAGRFAEADQVERDIQNAIRDWDPYMVSSEDLQQRARLARYGGNHQDAGLFERKAHQLLETFVERYQHLYSIPVPNPGAPERVPGR